MGIRKRDAVRFFLAQMYQTWRRWITIYFLYLCNRYESKKSRSEIHELQAYAQKHKCLIYRHDGQKKYGYIEEKFMKKWISLKSRNGPYYDVLF